ncbi:hypothetical protein APC39_15450 [Acinetobacter pittii]|uniref:hypothetical protein n=1 Tax=Acinetobacter pittii TaxID=48296 RepID=UPI0007075A16|nr:hypothetical protein [Acinetobacter pittii]KQG36980.1 hypothetical protein APC39_15450 [Acinetobacter pittii]
MDWLGISIYVLSGLAIINALAGVCCFLWIETNLFNKFKKGRVKMNNEELLEQLESVANFMRGMQFDPRIPADTKEALNNRVQRIDEIVEKSQED